MTRGNQREIDRQRAANRHDHSGAKLEGDPNKRREADAKALQDKIARKAAGSAGGGDAGGSGGAASSSASGGGGGGKGGGGKKK